MKIYSILAVSALSAALCDARGVVAQRPIDPIDAIKAQNELDDLLSGTAAQ